MFLKRSSNAVAPLEPTSLQIQSACSLGDSSGTSISSGILPDETSSAEDKSIRGKDAQKPIVDPSPKRPPLVIVNPSTDSSSFNSSRSSMKPSNEDQRLELLRNSQLLSSKSLDKDVYSLCALAKRNLKVKHTHEFSNFFHVHTPLISCLGSNCILDTD